MDTLNIVQLNIRNWNSNKYLFMVEMSQNSPDVILLNETSNINNNIKFFPYYTIQNCKEHFSGVAILIKKSLNYIQIPTRDENILAIKVLTSIGYILIATCYSPPRQHSIPTHALSRLFDYNLPTVILADFNAKHQMFHNYKQNDSHGRDKGIQLASLATIKNLKFIGSFFDTFVTPMVKENLI